MSKKRSGYLPLTLVFGDSFCPAFYSYLINPREARVKLLRAKRVKTERHYTAVHPSNIPDDVGSKAEYLPHLLLKRPELLEQVNFVLAQINFRYRVSVKVLHESNPVPFSVQVVNTETGMEDNLQDVGLGFRQVLPIVVQSLLYKYEWLLIEEPEAHLHPAQQAELGDLFIMSALGAQRNLVILKTHSELLTLRILRRIRETREGELPAGFPAVRPEDVEVRYVQPGGQAITIPVNDNGDFEHPWPHGFFAERQKELF